MHVVVCSKESLKNELVNNGTSAALAITWVQDAADFLPHADADAFIDLLFHQSGAHIEVLQQLLPKPVIINSVIHTLNETDTAFVRINGWPTFLEGTLVEASCSDANMKANVEVIFEHIGKKIEWLPDEPGFITPRVISTIINEAYLALAEGVSTKAEIDTAMKLGTAYPYGPFEWSRKIELHNIVNLLHTLSQQQKRYTPAALLVTEAGMS